MTPAILCAVDGDIRLNQIQVIGTHNSYHIAPDPAVMAAIATLRGDLARSLDYTHKPLDEQFSRYGIRQIELDIFVDSEGGRYANPKATTTVKGATRLDDPTGVMAKPGMKVLHVQDIDYQTTVLTLVDALKKIRNWLQANPTSVPIMVMLELKQSPVPGFTKPLPFTRAELDAVDAEILSVFEPKDIIRPDDVRGEFPTLRDSVTTQGWPRLDDVRGKVWFAMDNQGQLPEEYLKDHAGLKGRILFVSVDEQHDAAAFMKVNDPVANFDKIKSLVRSGFVVRTRADAGTKEARENDSSRKAKALASGAHFVSTDYPTPDERLSNYQVRLPGNRTARTNPISALDSPKDLD